MLSPQCAVLKFTAPCSVPCRLSCRNHIINSLPSDLQLTPSMKAQQGLQDRKKAGRVFIVPVPSLQGLHESVTATQPGSQ